MSVEPRNTTPSLDKNYSNILTDIQLGGYVPTGAYIETSPIQPRSYSITVDPTGYEYYLKKEHFDALCKEYNLTPVKG